MPPKPAGKQQEGPWSSPSSLSRRAWLFPIFQVSSQSQPVTLLQLFATSLPLHSPPPTSSLTCQSRSSPTHTFPYSLRNPPIYMFLIHLPVHLHNLSLKHLQTTQGEELCLPRPTCPHLSHHHSCALHPSFPEFEGRQLTAPCSPCPRGSINQSLHSHHC